MSAVQEASFKAQQQFLQPSMKDLTGTYNGPPKYLNQRDAPLEIPIEVIKNLLIAIDQNLDDKVSVEELKAYAQRKYLPFEDHVYEEMFREATTGRGVVHERQRDMPLTLEEIASAVRGRHRWNG